MNNLPMNTLPSMSTRCGKCEGCSINHRAICRAANPDTFEDLNRISHLREFTRGQIVQGQGEESSIVGNVINGVVKLSSASVDGEEHIVGLLFPSDFFGRAFAEKSRFSYEAATDVTLCCIKRTAFDRLLSDHPEVEHELLLATLDELDATREWSSIISAHTSMERVATFLYILAKRSKNFGGKKTAEKENIIHVPIARRDIAAYLGTTAETLSRNIQGMVREKVFRILDAKHFELLDETQLVHRTGLSRMELDGLATPRR